MSEKQLDVLAEEVAKLKLTLNAKNTQIKELKKDISGHLRHMKDLEVERSKAVVDYATAHKERLDALKTLKEAKAEADELAKENMELCKLLADFRTWKKEVEAVNDAKRAFLGDLRDGLTSYLDDIDRLQSGPGAAGRDSD